MFYCQSMHGLSLVLTVLLASRYLSVTAINCFLCGSTGDSRDPLLKQNPSVANDSLCRDFADTSELKKFSTPCPADANACTSIPPGYTQMQGKLARSCFKWPTADQKNMTCRSDVVLIATPVCPCYTDYCNVGSIFKDNVPGIAGLTAVITPNQTDKYNLATGGTFPTDNANANQPGGSNLLPVTTSNDGTSASPGSGGNSLLQPNLACPVIIFVLSLATLFPGLVTRNVFT